MTNEQKEKYLNDCVDKFLKDQELLEDQIPYLKTFFEIIFINGERSGMKQEFENTMNILKKREGDIK